MIACLLLRGAKFMREVLVGPDEGRKHVGAKQKVIEQRGLQCQVLTADEHVDHTFDSEP